MTTSTLARSAMTAGASASRNKGGVPFEDGFRRTLLALFLLALLLPIQPEAGGQRVDPYRMLLLVMFVPFVIALLSGRAGRFTVSDGLILGYGSWIILTIVFHHGFSRFAYASIWAVELVGGYMMGRLLIRSSTDYRRFISYFLTALLILLPFAFIELVTGRMWIGEILGKAFPVVEKFNEIRHGLSRVQAVFPHSILYGLFCSIGAANVYYLYRAHLSRLLPRLLLVVGMTVMALSSAPLLSIGMQMIMAIWDKLTRGRWMTLFVITTSLYVFLEFASNRGPIIILIETLTFDPSTAWWRVYIWEYGSLSVLNHPWFGIGLNSWVRPYWLDSTVDNFWLLAAMRHGFPGVGCLILGIAVHITRLLRARDLSPNQSTARTGYMVTLAGLLFTLCTVHVWDAMAVFVMFYIGAGSFLYTGAPETVAVAVDDPSPRSTLVRNRPATQPVEAVAASEDLSQRARLPYTRGVLTDRPGYARKPPRSEPKDKE